MTLSMEHIQSLLNRQDIGQKLSIYLPTHPQSNSQTINEDTIRLKNALQDIQNNPQFDEESLDKTVKALHSLLENTRFWKHQDVGLAIFADKNSYEYIHLPYEITEAAYIDTNFIISPLVVMHGIGSGYYLLDVNLNAPRLYRSANGTLVETEDSNLPGPFQDSVARDEYKMELQHQATRRSDTSFHGHDPAESVEDDIQRYLRLIAEAANGYLKGQDQPLILAGTESRVGNIRQHLTYHNVLASSIAGNQEAHTPQELHTAARDIIETYDREQCGVHLDKLLSSAPQFVARGQAEIKEAAVTGRVERLYLPIYRRTADTVRPGDFKSVILQLPTDIAELEALVRAVLAQNGEVLATEIDSYKGADMPLALCRY